MSEIKPGPAATAGFLKRSVISSAAVILMVALFAYVSFDRIWALHYLMFGFWSLGFFGLSGFLIKAMMFDRRPLKGFAFIAGKFLLLALAGVYLANAAPEGGERGLNRMLFGTLAGMLTPLAVVVLRAVGAMMGPGKDPIEAAKDLGAKARMGPLTGRFSWTDTSAPDGTDGSARHESEK